MVRPGTSLQTVVTMLRNMKENPGESVVLSPAMAQRQQSCMGYKREGTIVGHSSDVTLQANGQWMMRR